MTLIARAILGLIAAAGVIGCSTIKGTLNPPSPTTHAPQFLAGAARADITPPPGYPMGGHSIGGGIARGFWTRLWARAVYLEAPNQKAIVLVSCDLWSLPAGLGDRVAERLAQDPSTRHLGRDQVLLAATHTHHSPGNFSSCGIYNDHASPRSGFDPGLFEFLASRVTRAIQEACAARTPATAFFREKLVEGLARNRSFPAFVRNPECESFLQANASVSLGPRSAEFPAIEAWRAVDPRLAVLRVEAQAPGHATIALVGFFAVHPTAMKPDAPFNQGDLFGVATREAEEALRPGPGQRGPVVALLNGAEGDVSPAWTQQGRPEVLRLGRRLSQHLLELSSGGIALDATLDFRFTNAPLADFQFVDASGYLRRTADRPLPGMPTLGGAEDGRTILFEHGYVEGITGPDQPDQGVKSPALEPSFLWFRFPIPLTSIALSRAAVPRSVPLGLYRLGDRTNVTLATLPGEFTTVLGRRIADSIARRLDPAPARVLLAGLANEYVSYFTTPEEYAAQHYEGASTLYGPNSGPAVGHHLVGLATDLSTPAIEPGARKFEYHPGGRHRFGARVLAGDPPEAAEAALAEILHGDEARTFEWTEPACDLRSLPKPERAVVPHVLIERSDSAAGWVPYRRQGIDESNEGLRFVTFVTSVRKQQCRWRAAWIPPAEAQGDSTFRFRVDTADGRTLWSEPFRATPDPSAGPAHP